MAHVAHVTNFMVIVELTSTLSQCDAVLPVLKEVKVLPVVLSVDNEIQLHQLHHLNGSYHLKGPPSSQLYRTVSTGNDIQFHHLHDFNESYQLKRPPFSQLYRTAGKTNDMQFHHLDDLNESHQLKGPPFSQLTRPFLKTTLKF